MTAAEGKENVEAKSGGERRRIMALLAEAHANEIADGLRKIDTPAYRELRPAETGLVMVRGRIGGDGAPFNLGEATVTRATVQIASGEVGFAYVLGRDHEKAQVAALADALWQSRERPAVEQHVLAPVRARIAEDRQRACAETAATRVDFFTLVRGED